MKYSNHLSAPTLRRMNAGLLGLAASALLIAAPSAHAQILAPDASAIAQPNVLQFTAGVPNYLTPDGEEFFRQGYAGLATLIPLSFFSAELQASALNLSALGESYQPGELQTAGDAVAAQFAGADGLQDFISALADAVGSAQQFSDTIKGFLNEDNQFALGELEPLATNSESLREDLLALLLALNAMPRNGTPEQDSAIAGLFTAIENATAALEQAGPVSGQFSAEMDSWR
jgi:hypothetical protein